MSSTVAMTQRVKPTALFSEAFVNDVVSRSRYYRIISVNDHNDTLRMVNREGQQFQIDKKTFEQECFVAHTFYETQYVDAQTLRQIFARSYHTVMRVCFIKANGDDRVLTGYCLKPEHIASTDSDYMLMMDLERGQDNSAMRRVNLNTLQWFTVKNVRYMLAAKPMVIHDKPSGVTKKTTRDAEPALLARFAKAHKAEWAMFVDAQRTDVRRSSRKRRKVDLTKLGYMV
jgi:hypothetical protein